MLSLHTARPIVGLPIGMIRQNIWLGYYESKEDIANSPVPAGKVKPGYLKYKDLNDDGVIDTDDRAYMGKPNLPNTNIGLTLGFTYSNFSFSVLLQSADRKSTRLNSSH